jgi:hypothetical protein
VASPPRVSLRFSPALSASLSRSLGGRQEKNEKKEAKGEGREEEDRKEKEKCVISKKKKTSRIREAEEINLKFWAKISDRVKNTRQLFLYKLIIHYQRRHFGLLVLILKKKILTN